MERKRRGDTSRSVDGSSVPTPSLEDVLPRVLATNQAAVYPADNIQAVGVGPSEFIVVMELQRGHGLLARYANTSAIVQMVARHLDFRSAASVVAEEVLEPTDDWIPVDEATATALLTGDHAVIDRVFGTDAG